MNVLLLVFLSSAPVILLLFYIYIRDKFEKEPIGLIIKIALIGAITPIPIIFIEKLLILIGQKMGFYGLFSAFWGSFVVAGFTEELFKFLVVIIFIWNHKAFNEKFDGIVYAGFASLGFALVENILYVFSNGASVGIMRAFTAVPAHAIFGITMGYFFGLAKFDNKNQLKLLFASLAIPILLHGFYDFILMAQKPILMLFFIPYLIGMIYFSFRLMRHHSDRSKYNPKNKDLI